jgi:DUF917 family protein
MQRNFTLSDSLPFAIGCGILGTGGGGNTYIGRTWLESELRKRGGSVRIIDADQVPDDGYVCCIGTMGAPTVSNEKLQQGDEFVIAMRALEEHIGQPLSAVLCGEIGGANGIKPLICGLQMGLPVVDGDPMGRAFPELQMDTYAINGLSLCPMALSDAHGNVMIFDKMDSPYRVEAYARALTIEMGGSAALAMPLLRGRDMKANIIRDTMTLAQRIGDVVLAERKRGEEPAEAVAAVGNGHVLFRGKIVDVERRTVKGFARGKLKLVGFGDPNDTLEIAFQNENLIAWRNDEIVATVPDLICIIGLEDGEPIGTELLRYGLRVAVLGMPAPKELKTARALNVVGPKAFGYDVPFLPMAGDLL